MKYMQSHPEYCVVIWKYAIQTNRQNWVKHDGHKHFNSDPDCSQSKIEDFTMCKLEVLKKSQGDMGAIH